MWICICTKEIHVAWSPETLTVSVAHIDAPVSWPGQNTTAGWWSSAFGFMVNKISWIRWWSQAPWDGQQNIKILGGKGWNEISAQDFEQWSDWSRKRSQNPSDSLQPITIPYKDWPGSALGFPIHSRTSIPYRETTNNVISLDFCTYQCWCAFRAIKSTTLPSQKMLAGATPISPDLPEPIGRDTVRATKKIWQQIKVCHPFWAFQTREIGTFVGMLNLHLPILDDTWFSLTGLWLMTLKSPKGMFTHHAVSIYWCLSLTLPISHPWLLMAIDR